MNSCHIMQISPISSSSNLMTLCSRYEFCLFQVARLVRRVEPARHSRRAERRPQHHHVRRRHRGAVRTQPLSGRSCLYLDSKFSYRLSHLLVYLGGVDFDLNVSPSCPAVQPFLPNSHRPGRIRHTVELNFFGWNTQNPSQPNLLGRLDTL